MNIGPAVERFIDHKRSEGLKFKNRGSTLRSFARGLSSVEFHGVTPNQILDFLNSPKISTNTWRSKHALLTSFFRYCQILDLSPRIEMPPPRGLARITFTPYVYSRTEIRALLEATSRVRLNGNSTIHPETMRALLLFLYGTGARISEAIALRCHDIDLANHTMCLKLHGAGSPRILPIGPDLRRIFTRYSKWKRSAHIEGEAFLVRRDGSQLLKDGVYNLFRKLLADAGVSRRDHALHRPRIQDFRPTFAVHQIAAWIRKGRDLNRLLPALSGYMGQVDLTAAERFLALTPERFKNELDKLSPLTGKSWATNAETMAFLSNL